MKYLALLLLLPLLYVVGSCRSVDTQESWDNIEAYRASIEADGLVTPDEAATMKDMLIAHYKLERDDVASTDWTELLATGGATLLASLFATNAYRNRGLPGAMRKKDAAKA